MTAASSWWPWFYMFMVKRIHRFLSLPPVVSLPLETSKVVLQLSLEVGVSVANFLDGNTLTYILGSSNTPRVWNLPFMANHVCNFSPDFLDILFYSFLFINEVKISWEPHLQRSVVLDSWARCNALLPFSLIIGIAFLTCLHSWNIFWDILLLLLHSRLQTPTGRARC